MSATAKDVTWRWDITRPDGGVYVDAINIDMPEYRPGATLRMELEFWASDIDTQGVGGTLGTDTGFTLGGDVGATLGSNKNSADFIGRYEDVRQYLDVAGRASTNRTLDGTVLYRERLPSWADVSHIVVAVRPSTDLRDESTKGLWILLTGGDDRTEIIRDLARIEAQVTVLGTLDRYPSRDAIETDLKI